MSEAVRKSLAEYNRIRNMFMTGNPEAEKEWRKFLTADNGYSICSNYIGK